MKKLLLVTAAVVSIALGFSGCNTTKPAGDVGFPLIDIVDAVVEVADDSKFAGSEEKKWERSRSTKAIGGTLGSKIVPKDITIKLEMTSFQVPIKNGEDVTKWFLNIPKGLTASAHAEDPAAKFAAGKGRPPIPHVLRPPLPRQRYPERARFGGLCSAAAFIGIAIMMTRMRT